MKIVYIDGVFDLFHRGHLESLIKAKNALGDPANTYLIVGVVSDSDSTSYKKIPIINEEDRVAIIKDIKYVDKVIFPCPMYLTLDFIKLNSIDLVVHSFSGEADKEKQKKYFTEIKEAGYFQEINYYSKISTSEIINKIKTNKI